MLAPNTAPPTGGLGGGTWVAGTPADPAQYFVEAASEHDKRQVHKMNRGQLIVRLQTNRRGRVRPRSHLDGTLEADVDCVSDMPLDGAQCALELPAGAKNVRAE